MDYELDDTAQKLRRQLRDMISDYFASDFLGAFTDNPDDLAQVQEFCRVLAKDGLLARAWPEEFGGGGGSVWEQTVFREEMWAHHEPRGAQYMGINWVGPALMHFGTEQQQAIHLPPIAAGEVIWCQGFSEPEAGSDLGSLRTSAMPTNGGWLVSGQKIWTSYAQMAQWLGISQSKPYMNHMIDVTCAVEVGSVRSCQCDCIRRHEDPPKGTTMTQDAELRGPGLSQPRVAEMVADILRGRIVDGELADGDLLPKQDALLDEFRVSRPSIREAMRILETEGLVSVRRGNVGGAEVHAPNSRSAAYMLGLVMQSDKVTLADVGAALCILEPACAALAADRTDRATEVLPRLHQLNAEAEEQIEDGPTFTRLAREWHAMMVGSCGNQTMLLIVGTLETVWSHHEAVWADHVEQEGTYPSVKDRRLVLRAHVKISEAIEAGNAESAQRIARRHLAESQTYLLARDPGLTVNITGPTRRVGAFR